MAIQNRLIVSSNDQIHLINFNDIIVCKSDNCYTYIYLHAGNEFLICKSLAKVSKELCARKFIRVNQSYIINVDYIKSIDKKKKHIEMLNQTKIPFTLTIKDLLLLLNVPEAEG